MLSGADLIRRKEHEDAFALTCKLIMTHDGKKMGKTEKGALWLDPTRTTPFEFYQYWRNVGDQDVERFLGLLTFLPMDEVRRLGALPGEQINEAKRVLAFEVTKMIHGEAEAQKAADAALALFAGGAASQDVPTWEVKRRHAGRGQPPDHPAGLLRPVHKPRRRAQDGATGRGAGG